MSAFNGILVAYSVFSCEWDQMATVALSLTSLFLSHCWWDLVLNTGAFSVSLLSANVI